MKKLFILFIVLAGFGVSSFGQNNVDVNAKATIVAGIQLAKVSDINFGLIIPGAAANSTVTLGVVNGDKAAAGTGSPTILGNTSHNAELTVTAASTSTFSITVSPATISLSNGGSNMSLAVLTSGTSTGNVGSTTKIYVGGTLTIPAGAATQATGVYNQVTPVNIAIAYE